MLYLGIGSSAEIWDAGEPCGIYSSCLSIWNSKMRMLSKKKFEHFFGMLKQAKEEDRDNHPFIRVIYCYNGLNFQFLFFSNEIYDDYDEMGKEEK